MKAKLVSFTDTKIEAINSAKRLKRYGYTITSIRSRYGGWEVMGIEPKKIMRRKATRRATRRNVFAPSINIWR